MMTCVQHAHRTTEGGLAEEVYATGERWGPVLRPACLRAREPWSGVVCSECLHLYEDVELSLGKIFAHDCL